MNSSLTRLSSKATGLAGRFARPATNPTRSQARAPGIFFAALPTSGLVHAASRVVQPGLLKRVFNSVLTPIKHLVKLPIQHRHVTSLVAAGAFFIFPRISAVQCGNSPFSFLDEPEMKDAQDFELDLKSSWTSFFSFSTPFTKNECENKSKHVGSEQNLGTAVSSSDPIKIPTLEELIQEREMLKAELALVKESHDTIQKDILAKDELLLKCEKQLSLQETEKKRLLTENAALCRKNGQMQTSLDEYHSLITCKVCYQNPVSEHYTTCGHACVCNHCAIDMLSKDLHDCPVCRSPNANHLRQRIILT